MGKQEHICPYFLQKERAKRADLILMPYNYLIDEKIRENFDINYSNSIVIVDEAHNVNSVCEEVASLDISDKKLDTIMFELTNLKSILENREFSEKKLGSELECSAAECLQLSSMVEIMHSHLKKRDVSVVDWKNFVQKDGYIVAKADKIFDIISEITRNKEQRSLDEFHKFKKSPHKKSPSKISLEYEEEEETINTYHSYKNVNKTNNSLEECKDAKAASKVLNEVNAENLEDWISIMNKAITDLSTQTPNKLHLILN